MMMDVFRKEKDGLMYNFNFCYAILLTKGFVADVYSCSTDCSLRRIANNIISRKFF